MLRYAILGLMRCGGSHHGYALMKQYRMASGMPSSVGNLYRELHNLRGLGWVRAAVNPDGADPRRAPYEITDAGVRAFDAWLRSETNVPLLEVQDRLPVVAFLMYLARGTKVVDGLDVLDRWDGELRVRSSLLERAQMRSDPAPRRATEEMVRSDVSSIASGTAGHWPIGNSCASCAPNTTAAAAQAPNPRAWKLRRLLGRPM
jgi:DNA-binding PadR family transcriptional regulator